jgi:hypothetical protein
MTAREVMRLIERNGGILRAVTDRARDLSPVCYLRPVRGRRHTPRRGDRSPPGSPFAFSPHGTSGHRAAEDLLGHDQGVCRARSAKRTRGWAESLAGDLLPGATSPASFPPIRWLRDRDTGDPAGLGCDDAERGAHVRLLSRRMLPLNTHYPHGLGRPSSH